MPEIKKEIPEKDWISRKKSLFEKNVTQLEWMSGTAAMLLLLVGVTAVLFPEHEEWAFFMILILGAIMNIARALRNYLRSRKLSLIFNIAVSVLTVTILVRAILLQIH